MPALNVLDKMSDCVYDLMKRIKLDKHKSVDRRLPLTYPAPFDDLYRLEKVYVGRSAKMKTPI